MNAGVRGSDNSYICTDQKSSECLSYLACILKSGKSSHDEANINILVVPREILKKT